MIRSLGQPNRVLSPASSRILRRKASSSPRLDSYRYTEGETPVSRQDLLSLSPRLPLAYAAAIILALGFRGFSPATPSTLSCLVPTCPPHRGNTTHRVSDSIVLSLFQCPKELLRSHYCRLPRKQLLHKNAMNLIILIRTAIREHHQFVVNIGSPPHCSEHTSTCRNPH